MPIPIPHEPDNPDNKPLPSPPSPPAKPTLKDFDDESNWITSPTNPAIEINTITGRMRTKDFGNETNYPKSI
jgi:hypothetical protein